MIIQLIYFRTFWKYWSKKKEMVFELDSRSIAISSFQLYFLIPFHRSLYRWWNEYCVCCYNHQVLFPSVQVDPSMKCKAFQAETYYYDKKISSLIKQGKVKFTPARFVLRIGLIATTWYCTKEPPINR